MVDRLELVAELLLQLLHFLRSKGLIPKLEDFLGEIRENGQDVLAMALGLEANGREVGESSGPAVLELFFDDLDHDGVGLPEIDALKAVSLLHETAHVVFEEEANGVLLLRVEKPPLLLNSLLDALQGEENEIFIGGLLNDVSGLDPEIGLFVELFEQLGGKLHFLLVSRVEVVDELFE